MCRMKLKMIWHAPAQLHFLYKVNRIAVEKINKPPMNPLQIKKEEEMMRRNSEYERKINGRFKDGNEE